MALSGLADYETKHDALSRFILRGKSLKAQVAEAIEGVSLERRIDRCGLFVLTLSDPDEEIQRSDLFATKVALNFDDLVFEYLQLQKTGSYLTVTFEPGHVADLRRRRGKILIRPGTTTRTKFAERLVRDAGKGIAFRGETGTLSKTALMRKRNEDSWSCLERLATERNWRRFEDQGTIYFGSDQWLAGLAKPIEVSPRDEGVLSIDYDTGERKRADTANITCLAKTWAARPGAPVKLNRMGSLVGDRLWIVEAIERRDVFSRVADVALTRKVVELPEPKRDDPLHDETGSRAAAGISGVPGPVSPQGFQWPVRGAITGRFGDARPGHTHAGLDIDGETGDPIMASKPGVVVFAGDMGGYGHTVDIAHGDGLLTRYAHLSGIGVRSGQKVGYDTVVGPMGSTGNSTGSHLHFEVRRNEIAVDPLGYLP